MLDVGRPAIILLTGTNGSGKSEVVRRVLELHSSTIMESELMTVPAWHEIQLEGKRVIIAGRYDNKRKLPGPDAVPKKKIYKGLHNLVDGPKLPFDALILEGQKFAHGKDFERIRVYCKENRFQLLIFWVFAYQRIALQRAKARGEKGTCSSKAIEAQEHKISQTINSGNAERGLFQDYIIALNNEEGDEQITKVARKLLDFTLRFL